MKCNHCGMESEDFPLCRVCAALAALRPVRQHCVRLAAMVPDAMRPYVNMVRADI